MIHSIIEVDISRARESLRSAKREKQGYISFTGYIVQKVALAVEKNKHIHAYRNWKNELIMFDDVDVSTTIERRIAGESEVCGLHRSNSQQEVGDRNIRRDTKGAGEQARRSTSI
jgi:pyruvate/2-oxoglutarate dehydrogenase complex dihydrolipoamide acyltransferase (E2) component